MKTLSEIKKPTLLSTNSSIDELLNGGIEKGCITQFYGSPGCGKTNVCLSILCESVKNGSKGVYIDTEGGVSLDRIEQIAGADYEKIASNIYFLEPKSFDEQINAINNIEDLLKRDDTIDLIIIDSVVALYRIEDGDVSEINKKLGRLMAHVLKISRVYDVAIVITNQIYSPFDEDDLIVEPIGGTVLKYWSKVIIKIEQELSSQTRIATLQRHKSKPTGETINFEINDNGIT